MIRLVVSDVDGTLVRRDKSLSPQTIAAVHRLRAAEIPFTLISARPVSGVMPLVAPLGIDIPLAAFNGGILFRPDGSEIVAHPIDRAVVEGVFALAEELAVDRWVFASGQWYASADQGVHVEHERVASNQAPIVRTNFADLYDAADKVTFVSDERALLKALADRAVAAFGDRATIGQSQTYYLDVTDTAANKGDGVAALAQMLGIDLADVVVLGDMDNDVAMFDRAGLSVAMGQAPDAVKAKADWVSSTNQEDGVAHAIDAFILPKVQS
ncbi:Cof-type HAD-IIB family hydrolase [Sphingomonas bacterium]|uniref:Cof-type HAD-IIB family hydrolase n=1 Tax=Sphingomonas bacterium TaxID=1895847 RepID=UPI00262A53BD|nr:Cof-type HAD-IIB family hydrolase [Sphingomonas bacterium]MDB5678401.1 Cof-type family hydrolase [Sphingomonas bacterium]